MHQMVSVTDLRKQANHIIKRVENGCVYVLVSNKCRAVMISPEEYDRYIRWCDDQDILDSAKSIDQDGMSFDDAQGAINYLESMKA